MVSHPHILARPRELWRGRGSSWREEFDGRVIEDIRTVLKHPSEPLQVGTLGVLPYRPDLFHRVGPAALRHPSLRTVLFSQSLCALELLTLFYDETAPYLESSLAGCGESVYGLLHWSADQGKGLLQTEKFYRQALITDGYWGLKYARDTGNASLQADVRTWCGDERRNYAAAAALFLIQNPSERASPSADLILSHPFYAYLALPHLAGRGVSFPLREMGRHPKWAWHFAQSSLVSERDRQELLAGAMRDPGWALEWAAVKGWLGTPHGRAEAAARVASAERNHPLREPAMLFLESLEHPQPRPTQRPEARARPVPRDLSSGQNAEARALRALRFTKNTDVWRPSLEQVGSPDFRAIVGEPLYTVRGIARGTVVDGVGDGLAEIKSGRSVLNSTYQLRLQTYRSVIEERPLKIYTNRPVDVAFGQWLDPWGVKIEPMPGPEP